MNSAWTAVGATSRGEDCTFETSPELPVVFGASVSNLKTDGVVFHGFVNPGNGVTTYHVEYGLTAGYGSVLASVGIGGGFLTRAIEQASETVLRPGTEYHYAIVAENRAGTTVGEDQTFTTLPAASAPPPGEVALPEPGAPPAPSAVLFAPSSPALLAAVAFPSVTSPQVEPRTSETRAQKLARALARCAGQPRGKRRAACRRRAGKRYGPAARRRKR
jgi:hypothetical protein